MELIVQPDAHDTVGEMRVCSDRPRGRNDVGEGVPKAAYKSRIKGTASRNCGVERAKVNVKALDFPSPVSPSPPALRAEAHHPTDINVMITDGTGSRDRERQGEAAPRQRPAECVRYLRMYLADGYPPSHIGQ